MNGFRCLLGRASLRGATCGGALTWRGSNARHLRSTAAAVPATTCRSFSLIAPRRNGEAQQVDPPVTLPSRQGVGENEGNGGGGDLAKERQWSTPLAKKLATAMDVMGPMPLARYMRMCLTSDQGGYYTRGDMQEGQDQFGVKGDFVTAPEISQVFGELVGVWFVMQWMKQRSGKQTESIEIIEAGPGRGTLMADMLRIFHRFDMTGAIDAIYMVETSAQLREVQKNLLCGPDAPMTESKVGYHSICKHTNLPIVWTQAIQSIPKHKDTMPFIIAHEFFDALPIHAFQGVEVAPDKSANGRYDKVTRSKDGSQTRVWRELVVTPIPTQPQLGLADPAPEFQLSVSKGPTRHSQTLPLSSARYKNLKAAASPSSSSSGAGTGTGRGGGGGGSAAAAAAAPILEICPDATLYAADFAARIGGSPTFDKPRPSGAALIFDYGPGDGRVPVNSLRGIRRHRRVSPLAEPGLVDISADVDFAALAQAATRASENVEVWGPAEQAGFLLQMGVRQRAEQLVKKAATATGGGGGEALAKQIDDGWKRLVDEGSEGMGKLYKAMAIVPDEDGKHPPPGFGRDLAAEEGH